MQDKTKDCCFNCRYWRKWEDRVFALIEGKTENYMRGDELRRCQYRPAPGGSNHQRYYTSEDWHCSEFFR